MSHEEIVNDSMSTSAQAGQYIQEKQREIGLALLILMQESHADTCQYSIDLVGKGKRYKVVTTIEEVEKEKPI
jgi:hypothetical protein